MTSVVARLVIRVAGLFVPWGRRTEWREEWQGELAALEHERAQGAAGLPGMLAYALGAVPHALWMRREGWTMDSILQDLRFSTRVLLRSPGFTLVAALTLALGIGANASIFSLVNGLLFRSPAGIHEPGRLVQIARSYESAPRWDRFSWPAMELIREESRAFSGVAGYSGRAFVVGRGTETQQVPGQFVTGDYFEVLGVQPALGRLLQPTDDVNPGEHSVVVLSHSLWANRFGSDPSIVGSTIPIGAKPYEIIGVAPQGFAGPESVGTPPAIWVPGAQRPGFNGQTPFDQWGWSWIQVVGRLNDGVSFEQAEASMGVVSSRLREASTINKDMLVLLAQGVGLDPRDRAEAKQISIILALIVGVVLLLTCTNVANLFLARAASRRGEVAVRMALGAGRGRLARQLITESVLLGLVATAIATPIVLAADSFLPKLFPYSLNVSVGADWRVLTFLVAVGIGAGLLFGAAPAWASSRSDVREALREGGSTGGRRKTRLRDILVISQLALSLGLVAGAALLGRSVLNARSAQPGFEPAGLVVGYVDLQPTGRYDEELGRMLWDRMVVAATQLPGVENATVAGQAPIVGGHSRATVRPAGRDDVDYEAEYTVVGANYFETLRIPILRGRALGGLADEPERVVVVNNALARMFWPGEDPIGKELAGDPGWRVVGVAQDVQMRSLRRAGQPGVYYPLSQAYGSGMALHIRGENGHAIEPALLRGMVAELDPELPVATVVDLHEGLTASMGETRTIGYLVAAFAVLALVLAAVGLYGLVSYGASERVREMGIRIALGARPESLVKLVLTRGITISMLGIGAGLVVSYGLGKALEGLLFGVAPADFATLGAASVTLFVTAGFAAWLPARRASRVDAAVSLRE